MEDTKTYSFAEALLTPTHVICGVEVKPFSLGHWSFLDQYGSPMLSEDLYPEEVSDNPVEQHGFVTYHILLFLLVTAHTYEENHRLYTDPEYLIKVKTEFEAGLIKHIEATKGWNIYLEVDAIKSYLDYYINSMPNFVEKGTPSKPSGIDWKQNLYGVMKNEYGYTESQIMNMSMRRMYAEWVGFAAKSGAVEVKSRQQVEAEAQAAEYVKNIVKSKLKVDKESQSVV